MRKVQAVGLVAALALIASACGSDNNDEIITDQQGAAIGGAIAAQLATVPESFTSTEFTATATGGGIFFARHGLGMTGIPSAPNLSSAPCPAVDDLTDTDGDGVPDDATFTFVAADCTDSTTYEVSGTIRIQDVPAAAVGYIGTFGNFNTTVFGTGTNQYSLEFDGSHGVAGTAALAVLAEDITISVAVQENGQNFSGTVSNEWQVTFDPTNDDLAMDTPLPDGAFDVSGSFRYDIGGVTAQFDITVISPLMFDSTCTQPFPFSSGEVRAHVEGEGGNVYARIVYTGCGVDPDVTFFGRNS